MKSAVWTMGWDVGEEEEDGGTWCANSRHDSIYMYVCTKRVHAMFLSGRPAKATSLRHCTKSLNHPNKIHKFRIFVIGKSGIIGFPFFLKCGKYLNYNYYKSK